MVRVRFRTVTLRLTANGRVVEHVGALPGMTEEQTPLVGDGASDRLGAAGDGVLQRATEAEVVSHVGQGQLDGYLG